MSARESQIVLGLDPDPTRLWPRALERVEQAGTSGQSAALRAAQAVSFHCALVIEAVAEQCVAVKLQVACFERLGAAGWTALVEVAAHARRHDLLVIADAKRGDIDVSATAYGEAFFGQVRTPYGSVPGLGADALTVNPLLGSDAVIPFVQAAREVGGGLFVLVRTSNPSAGEIQEQMLSDGRSVSEQIAGLVDGLGSDGVGGAGLSDVGAVVGATVPERLARMREVMPSAVFLLPGVGAQGGRVEDLAAAFAPGPAGGLIAASRSIVGASERGGGDPAQAAAEEARRLRSVAWQFAA